MKLEKLQKFNHGSQGVTYNCNGLTSEQYNKIYLQACNKYNTVNQDNVTFSIFTNNMIGYILCK